jgi:hypothetical protein
VARDVQNGTAVARLLGEPPQMRTGLVTLGAPGEDGCFAVVYEASGVAAEERGTLPAHDVFRYAVELPPPSFAQQSDNGRSAWWQGVRQRVPDTAVFVRSRTVDALRFAWDRIDDDDDDDDDDGDDDDREQRRARQRRVLLAREPGGPPPVPKAYQTALECAAHVYECGSAPLTLNSARLRHQRHMSCGEYVINCAPPGADDEVVCCSADGTWAQEQAGGTAALAAASMEGHCFIKNEECPLAAYSARRGRDARRGTRDATEPARLICRAADARIAAASVRRERLAAVGSPATGTAARGHYTRAPRSTQNLIQCHGENGEHTTHAAPPAPRPL